MDETPAVNETKGTTVAVFRLSPVVEENSGEYTCVASNEFGSVNRSLQLELQGECTAAAERK